MVRSAILGIIGLLSLTGSQAAFAQSAYPFLDQAFVVPEELVTPDFRLRMLTVHDVVKDFEAVTVSKTRLLKMFPTWGG